MDRRRFVAVIGSAFAAPRTLAQTTKSSSPRRVGFLLPTADPGPKVPGPQRGGSMALRKLGWIEGENLIIERAFADRKYDRLPGLAEGLVRKGVEVIATDGSEATLAAARATMTVPIVFGQVVWPVEQGLINSFARPGRNLTGIAYYTGVEVTNKRLEFLRQVAPAARRLSWLWPGDFAETVSGGRVDMAAVMGAAAKELGFETRFHDIRKPEDVEPALNEAAAWRAQALQVSGGLTSATERQRIADFALHHRLPCAAPSESLVEAGALLSYAPSPSEGPHLLARYFSLVDRILRGAKPADIPVERPSKYDLVINLKTAKALGLNIPQPMLLRAERVIE
jgi:putative ABC transport system substrate-binding protein